MSIKLDFIGIGVEKGGSTWLAQMMSKHPSICFPKDSTGIYFYNKRDSHNPNRVTDNYELIGYKWYEDQFSLCSPNAIKGEMTPVYIYCQDAIERIAADQPDIKIICILRNPVKRAFSQYLHEKKLGLIKEDTSFEEVIQSNIDLLDKGLYYKHLQNIYAHFPTSNIHISLLDDVKEDPVGVLDRVFQHIGAETGKVKSDQAAERVNTAKKPLFPWLNAWIYSMKTRLREIDNFFSKSLLLLLRKIGISTFLVSLPERLTKKDENPQENFSESQKKYLLEYYKEDIIQLEKLIQRDLHAWLE